MASDSAQRGFPAAQPSQIYEWSSDVRAFCRDYDVSRELKIAIRLANKLFPLVEVTNLQTKQDLESGAEWIQIKIATRATVEDAVEAYDRYIREWVRETSPQSRSLVRLSFKTV